MEVKGGHGCDWGLGRVSGQFIVKSEGGVNAGTYMLLTRCNQPITNVLCDVLNTELTQGRNAAYARPLRCAATRHGTTRTQGHHHTQQQARAHIATIVQPDAAVRGGHINTTTARARAWVCDVANGCHVVRVDEWWMMCDMCCYCCYY